MSLVRQLGAMTRTPLYSRRCFGYHAGPRGDKRQPGQGTRAPRRAFPLTVDHPHQHDPSGPLRESPAMERLFEQRFYLEQWEAARAWIAANAVALSLATLGQLLVIGLAYLAAK